MALLNSPSSGANEVKDGVEFDRSFQEIAAKKSRNSKFNDEVKRRTRFMWLFVLNICAAAMGHVILTVYTNGVIRTIERRFGLSSAKTGLLNSCNDIIHICLVIFVGYFGQKYNKPRIICITIMFSAFAGFMMASPHFLFSDYENTHAQRRHVLLSENGGHSFSNSSDTNHLSMAEDNVPTPNPFYSVEQFLSTPPPNAARESQVLRKAMQENDIQYCARLGSAYNVNLERENCQNLDQDRVHPAFYIFVIAQLISGIGSSGAFTLSMAYVDENAPKHKASIYIGAFMSLFSFAPVTGFMLATMCLKFPERLFSGKSVEFTDPSFIGCWWMGFMIGGIYITLCAIPLWWYPTKFESKQCDLDLYAEKVNLIEVKKNEGLLEQMKGIPKAFAGLMANKLYVINVCQIICGAYTVYGVFVNLVRYIEIHFNRTAAEGSIIAGAVSAVTGAVGNITGGVLVSRFKLRALDGIRLVLFSSFVFASGLLIIMNLGCPQVEMDMNYDKKLDMNTALNDCNQPCLCTTNRVDYRPICASDNISYFSPCIAGCSESINGTYTNCKCLRKSTNQNSTSFHEYSEGTARNGYCIPPCSLIIPFAITLFVMTFCSAISRVPATMISFRIVKDEERSFALGVNSFAINLLGFVPSPLIFGYLIDKSCNLWQVTCKVVGACLMYDVARFRYTIFGGGFFIEVINFSLNFVLFLSLRKMTLGLALLSRQPEIISEKEINRNDGQKSSKFIEDDMHSERNVVESNDVQLTKL